MTNPAPPGFSPAYAVRSSLLLTERGRLNREEERDSDD
jgi:hypothetical protein